MFWSTILPMKTFFTVQNGFQCQSVTLYPDSTNIEWIAH